MNMARMRQHLLVLSSPTVGWLVAAGINLFSAVTNASEQDWRLAIFYFGLMGSSLIFAHNKHIEHLTSDAMETSRRDSA